MFCFNKSGAKLEALIELARQIFLEHPLAPVDMYHCYFCLR